LWYFPARLQDNFAGVNRNTALTTLMEPGYLK
jgi:hypothetical protein